MTTAASTATIRAWAQSEGLDVAQRGRLKPEVLDAFAAANGKGGKRTPAAVKKAPVGKPAPEKVSARKAAAKPTTKPKAIARINPVSEVIPSAEDIRFAELHDTVAALTARVAKLEAAASAPTAKPKKFGRKS